MEAVTLEAHAKINLGLDVLRKRKDGYHEVRMIMQSVSLADTLELRTCGEAGVRLRSRDDREIPAVPLDDTNLICRAVRLVQEECRLDGGVEAILTKRIPAAAGLAGGSTDAAAALKGMNRLFGLGLSETELCGMGVRLGADIPYCIMGGTALAEGIGERLTPLASMPDCRILIAKPPIGVSTAFVYGNLKVKELKTHPDIDGIREALERQELTEMAGRMGNVLETVTIPAYPVIETIKNQMLEHGALQALMSGSGPTVFGLYTDERQAAEAGQAIQAAGLSGQLYLTRPV